MQKFILASASPRRREILTRLGIDFIVHPSGADEEGACGSVDNMVRELAVRKAEYVAREYTCGTVIGCDTLVSIDGEPLGKPRDRRDAIDMLTRLSGRNHEVLSGICLYDAGQKTYIADAVVSKVFFRRLTAEEIENYVDTGEPMDKAGSYAIQGGAAKFVERIEGSYDNIVGFPSERFIELINRG